MFNEANRLAPHRRRWSDGSIGDTAHASRASFHNPSGGYVDALDLTHDPARGWDAHARARQIVRRGDSRIDHVISNRQVWSRARPYWRAYTGTNPHTGHAHFGVRRDSTGRTSTRAWWSTITPPPPQEEDMPLNDADKAWIKKAIADANHAQNLWSRAEIGRAVADIKKNAAILRDGLAALIRRLPGAPQD
jgi:hypothetical protein